MALDIKQISGLETVSINDEILQLLKEIKASLPKNVVDYSSKNNYFVIPCNGAYSSSNSSPSSSFDPSLAPRFIYLDLDDGSTVRVSATPSYTTSSSSVYLSCDSNRKYNMTYTINLPNGINDPKCFSRAQIPLYISRFCKAGSANQAKPSFSTITKADWYADNIWVNNVFTGTTLKVLPEFCTGKVTSLSSTFQNSTAIEEVQGITPDKDCVTQISFDSTFAGCTGLKKANIDFSIASSLSSMFYNCSSLVELVKPINSTKNPSMYRTFYGCTSLVDITNFFDFDVLTPYTLQEAFYGCTNLTTVPAINMAKIGSSSYVSKMFYNCTKLKQVRFKNVSDYMKKYLTVTNLTADTVPDLEIIINED